MSILIEAKSVSKKYDERYVLKDINMVIDQSQFVVVLGHSGSGKSTMLNIISSIMKPTSGQILYKGKDLTKLNKREISKIRKDEIGYVFQHYMLLPNLTARENIQIGSKDSKSLADLDTIAQYLGIDRLLEKYPHQLSGGEQQRVCIARAILKKPTIIFCDEATGALDRDNSINIIGMLHQIKKKYKTSIVFTTHNREIAETAERILLLEDGKIVSDKKNPKIVSPENMKWEI